MVLICGLVLLSLLSTGLVMGFLSANFSQKAIDNLANPYLSKLNINVLNKATTFLLETSIIATKYATAMQFDNKTFNQTEFHRRFLFETMKTLPPYYDGVYFGAEDNQWWFMYGFDHEKQHYVFNSRTVPDVSPANPFPDHCNQSLPLWIYENYIDPSGLFYKQNWTCGFDSYNSTGRPWYLAFKPVDATRKTRQVWSDVYVYEDQRAPQLGYTLSMPVWHKDEFLGVAAVDTTAPFLTNFLQDQAVTSGAVLFMMDDKGQMVATAQRGVSIAEGEGDDMVPIKAINWAHESRIPEMYKLFGTRPTSGVVTATLRGEKHYVVISTVDASGAENMNWRVCIAIPAMDFLGEIEEGRKQMIISMAVLGFVVLIICLIISFLIYKPIATLEGEMEAVAEMDLEDVDLQRPPSGIKEVGSMQKSFVMMVKNLVQYRAFMPQAILEKPDETNDEGDRSLRRSVYSAWTRSRYSGHSSQGVQSPKSSKFAPSFKNPLADGSIPSSRFDCCTLIRPTVILTIRCLAPEDTKLQTFVVAAVRNVKALHGVVHQYRAGTLIATWTKSGKANCPHILAARAGNEIREILQKEKIDVAMGIAISKCKAGNLGSADTMMFNELCGEAVEESAALCALCEHLRGRILITQGMHQQCGSACIMRKAGHKAQSIGQLGCVQDPPVFEILDLRASEKTAEDSEWMYIMEEEDKLIASFKTFESAVVLYVEGETERALKIFHETTEASKTARDGIDALAARYVELCRSTMDVSHPGIPMIPVSYEQTTAMLRAKFQGIHEESMKKELAKMMCKLWQVEWEDTASLETSLCRLSKGLIQTMKPNQKVMRQPEEIEEIPLRLPRGVG